ncbi:MAG: hypothetical protein JJE35_05480 [Thermoleophilia bacterium]|nr:hypothetical protein [Thermoleophilia bacterium]
MAAKKDPPPPLTPEQVKTILRAFVWSSVLGLFILLGGAIVVPDSRGLFIGLAAVYVLASGGAFWYLRRNMQRRLEQPPS